MNEASGLAGDRRRNPFPSLNDTEYALLMSEIKDAARKGAEDALKDYRVDHCDKHLADTESLMVTVYGRREKGIIGMDQRVDEHDKALKSIESYITWLKVTLATALVALVVSLVAVILKM